MLFLFKDVVIPNGVNIDYEALEKLTENAIAPEEEKETRDNIKEKLTRYKSIMIQKNNIIKSASEEIKSLKLSKEAYKHDSKMQEDILEQQKKDLDKIEKKNDKMNRDKVDVMRELDVLRESNGSLNKKNNDLSEMLKVKNDLIKALREEHGAEEDEDEVEVAEIVEEVAETVEDVTEVVRMNRVSKYHTCNACDKNFKTSQDLENHVGSKHVEKDCDYCEKRFRNEHDLGKHLKTCDQIGTANKVCNKCNKKFTGPGLVRHNPTCHGNNTEYECPVCGEILNSSGALEDHQDQQHEMEQVRSREVCYHWRRGSCLKGDSCRFSHVGIQNKTGANKTTTNVALCKNGASCAWLANKTCSYFHPRIGVQRPWVHKERRQGGRQDRERGQVGRQDRERGQGGRQDWEGGQQGRQDQERGQGGRQDRERGQGGRQDWEGGQRGRQDRERGPGGRQDWEPQSDRPDCQYDGFCEAVPNCPDIHSIQVFPVFQGRRNPGGLRNQARRRN